MIFLPVSINITGKRILIIGGGKVAAHKMKILSRFTNNITILAPEICNNIHSSGFNIINKKYHSSNLEGYHLVYVCTDNHLLNKLIKKEAKHLGILVNVADNPELCDFVSPAIYKKGNLTVAVGSNAQNVHQSIAVRNAIQDFLENNSIPDRPRGAIGEGLSLSSAKSWQPNKKKPLEAREVFAKVTLVGFGPGDPELLTIKALSCLENADVIFYDALLDSDYLQRFAAIKVPVGKRCGKHSKQQEEINELLLQAAKSGQKVVRLKGGDPMIFGRGGEEFTFLTNHHIEVEIIPGITTALAASAQSAIPLTQRLISSSVAFCNGHNLNNKPFPKADTLVFYMGTNRQQDLAKKLISEGWESETCAALISRVSYPDSKEVVVTLNELSKKEVLKETPLLIIVGNTIKRSFQRRIQI